jgi:hypothetical protein
LVEAFKPKDIFPCTVDPSTWSEEISIRNLFGHLCSGTRFVHDELMRGIAEDNDQRPRKRPRSDASLVELLTQESIFGMSIQKNERGSTPNEIHFTATIESYTKRLGRQHDHVTQIGSPEHTPAASQSARAGEEEEEEEEDDDDDEEDTTTSASPNSKIRAIKLALKRYQDDHEVQFHLSSSPASDSDSNAAASPSLRNHHHHHRQDHQQQQAARHHHTTSNPSRPHKNDSGGDDTDSIISLSPSAFDSQQTERIRNSQNNGDDGDGNTTNAVPSEQPAQSSMCSVEKSSSSPQRYSRIAAYRAARSGTFEAWSSFFSPVTAGNNHTEEEVEL